uniref:Aluminum-activated malate transporter n=1 Tax=Oryza nivara TaxID=4536 RepID=A0A0E0HNU9_ORYNI
MAAARAPPPAQLGSLWSALEDQRGGAQEEEEVPFLLSSASWGLPGEAREKEGRAGAAVARAWGAARAAAEELWALARGDPRKAVFAAKVGLALALISLLVFVREPRDIVSHSVWAILTVVVVFEFSIGTQTKPSVRAPTAQLSGTPVPPRRPNPPSPHQIEIPSSQPTDRILASRETSPPAFAASLLERSGSEYPAMAAAGSAGSSPPPQPGQLGTLWSTLEDQRGGAREVPLLSSAWGLPGGGRGGDGGGEGGGWKEGLVRRAGAAAARVWGAVRGAAEELWALARADPRKAVFAAKVGLALALISLLVFLREPRDIVSHSVWAILTVVVVFEFSIGATFSKGFNRGLGTLTAGGLALAVAELSKHLGKLEEVILIISIFIVAFFTTLTKLHPKMKAYEYGFRVFLLTFCYVMVSGYNTGKFTDTAVSRFILIAVGAAVSLGINVGIYPIWAGQDLHNLVAKNFIGVAKSLEGCVDGYLKCMEYERIPSKILVYQASDDPLYSGYRAAVEASAQEETLLGFAIWEPPHGAYKMMKYPWRNFTKVESRKVFSAEIHRVGIEGAKVLRELGDKVKTMTKLSSSDILAEVHLAAEQLQKRIDEKSYLLVNTERWDTSKQAEGIKEVLNGTGITGKENKIEVKEPTIVEQTTAHHSKSFAVNSFLSRHDSSSTVDNFKLLSWPARRSFHPNLPLEDEETKTYESASALSLATFASLLIEFVARLQNVVNAFQELSDKANFKEPVQEPVAVSTSDGGFLHKICKFVGIKS